MILKLIEQFRKVDNNIKSVTTVEPLIEAAKMECEL